MFQMAFWAASSTREVKCLILFVPKLNLFPKSKNKKPGFFNPGLEDFVKLIQSQR
jgi:hypothetical protein